MNDGFIMGRWEFFQDASYFDMWCVRRVGDDAFGQGVHVVNRQSAEQLVKYIMAIEDTCKLKIESDMTKRYEIRAGTRAPCELVSISPLNWSPDGVNVIFDGTYTACKQVADDLGVVIASEGFGQ